MSDRRCLVDTAGMSAVEKLALFDALCKEESELWAKEQQARDLASAKTQEIDGIFGHREDRQDQRRRLKAEAYDNLMAERGEL